MERKITKDELEDCYGHSIHEACIILKLEMNELKVLKKDKFFLTFYFYFQKWCRHYNINRWPKKKSTEDKSVLFQTFSVPKNKKILKKERNLIKPIAPKYSRPDFASGPSKNITLKNFNPNEVHENNVLPKLKINEDVINKTKERTSNSIITVEKDTKGTDKMSIHNLIN